MQNQEQECYFRSAATLVSSQHKRASLYCICIKLKWLVPKRKLLKFVERRAVDDINFTKAGLETLPYS